jgi:superfamily II DNA helicase RecQ
MRYAFFSVPAVSSFDAAAELNRLLASHRIGGIEKHFVADGANSFWALCVGYFEGGDGAQPGGGKNKIDYREVLSEQEFAAFVKLRDLRREIAEQEALPAYAIFTNEQMAAMVRLPSPSLASIADIAGIGRARVDKYGARFLALLGQDRAAGKTPP